MNKMFVHKLKEALLSVMPLSLIVILLNLTPLVSFTAREMILFAVCSLLLILGIALFNLGADLAMTPMGEHVGAGLTKSARISLLLSVCFMLGVLITIAEPDLTVLAEQVSAVINPTVLTLAVGVGVGIFLVLGVLKIVFSVHLSSMLMFFYMTLFAVAAIVISTGKEPMLSMGFDSGGVTTGPITVPFIMALGVGVAATLGDKKDKESSFGFIALCSIGPILAVMLLGIFSKGELNHTVPEYGMDLSVFFHVFGETLKNVFIALAPIVVFFFILQAIFMRNAKRKVKQIIVGVFYTFFGLVIFLAAVEIGFMPVGFKMGVQLAKQQEWVMVAIAFLLGFTVVMAEPAIHVLNKQVEAVTGGAVKKSSMLIALSCGVGVSIALSVVRVIFGFSVLYYLIPGYFLSLGLSFFVPKIYTAIAFDSGGVASGPLTSTFILPFIVGVCFALGGNVLTEAFGLVAMVAMTPLISIQSLGFKAVVTKHVKEKIAMKRIIDADDEQIISFM